MRILTTDVVIVGGGAAGCYAALELSKKQIKSIIVCKGLVGKSGASIFAGNLVLGGALLGNTPEQARQYGRVSRQISQPVPDRSELGAPVRAVDREGLLPRA
ncbi:MAG: FAD-dependent oxidoreductase [Bradyrhizobium sp.]